MTISVILPTYNRSNEIKDTLDCLINQETNNEFDYEIIVIDNNSKDHTQKVLAAYALDHQNRIRCLFELRQGKSYALNSGIKIAKGDIIACVDDDCVLDKDYLWHIHQVFEAHGPDIGILGGKICPKWIGRDHPIWLDGLFNQPAKLEDGRYNGLKISLEGALGILDLGNEPFIIDYQQQGHPELQFYGANLAFRKKCLEKYGYFNINRKLGEDSEICKRLFNAGVKGIYAPNVKLYHKIVTSKATPTFYYRWWFIRGTHKDLKEKRLKVILLKIIDALNRSFQEKNPYKRIFLRKQVFSNLGQLTKLFKQVFYA